MHSFFAIFYGRIAVIMARGHEKKKKNSKTLFCGFVFTDRFFTSINQYINRNEDPAEYLRQGYDLVNELTSPRAAAVNLLLSIVEKAGGGKKASRSGSSQSYLPKVLALKTA